MTPDSEEHDDVKRHLLNIEARLERLSAASQQNLALRGDDEIDLRELWSILWRGKWWIFAITLLFAVVGLVYALSLPNMYTSKGVFAPAQKEGAGAGMIGQLGGLASFAGVNLGGGESKDVDQAIALITSWSFLETVIVKHNLKPFILGVKGWDQGSGQLIWDREIYDPIEKKWLNNLSGGADAEPSSFETYLAFKRMLNVSLDSKTSMVDVEVEHYSPELAQRWVSILIDEINHAFRRRDMTDAQKNIEFLEKKIAETSISEMQSVFFGMIESQMQTLMLAEVGDQYLLRDVIPPKKPELKSSPKRAFICALAIVLGGIIAALGVLARGLISLHD